MNNSISEVNTTKYETSSQNKIIDIEDCFNEFGFDKTLRYILFSQEVNYLPKEDISKETEYLLLLKKEKTIISYLIYLNDKNRLNVTTLGSINDRTSNQKLSARQIKYRQGLIDNLTIEELNYYKSFIDVFKIDCDGLFSRAIKRKCAKINSLYRGILRGKPNFDKILKALAAKSIKNISEQDLIAFFSLASPFHHRNSDSLYTFSASIWNSIFGKRNVKKVKNILISMDVIETVYNYVPGFRSVVYRINWNAIIVGESTGDYMVDISSIKTLVKINRIKRYVSEFGISELVVALEKLSKLHTDVARKSGNITTIFINFGALYEFIKDLKFLLSLLNNPNNQDERLFYLAQHITLFKSRISKGRRVRYQPFWHHKFDEVKNDNAA